MEEGGCRWEGLAEADPDISIVEGSTLAGTLDLHFLRDGKKWVEVLSSAQEQYDVM